jgi:hypothetical protein
MPPGDLRVDTSPEVLGHAIVNNQNYHAFGFYPSFGSSLTSNLQGLKRPLGTTTKGNVAMPSMQQQHFGSFKVSHSASTYPIKHCSSSPFLLHNLRLDGRLTTLPGQG